MILTPVGLKLGLISAAIVAWTSVLSSVAQQAPPNRIQGLVFSGSVNVVRVTPMS